MPQPKHGRVFIDRLRSELESRDVTSGRIELSHKNGEVIPIHFRASEIGNKEKEALGYVVVAQEQRDENEPIKENGNFGRSSDENPFPVLSIERDGTLLYANRASWLLLADWGTEVGQRVPNRWALLVEETCKHNENCEAELQIGIKTYQLEFVPKVAHGYVNVFGVDVTRRKQVEKKLHMNSQIFESSSEGIMIVGTDMRILDVNRAFCTITGYRHEEILGEPIQVLQSGRQDTAFYDELWKSVSEKGSWHGEIRDHRKNGELYPKWLSISAITDEDGQISRYVGLFSDISTIKQTEEQLYHMAHYDSLTGLANRRYFQEILARSIEQSRRSAEQMAVMFIDLDAFKFINDSLGHLAGDELLR
ncbi:MAG: PAS domain S-box protein [Chloroflexi bacterium]|nr:PAS domain S-box protein [Chloroflexota bacterium]